MAAFGILRNSHATRSSCSSVLQLLSLQRRTVPLSVCGPLFLQTVTTARVVSSSCLRHQHTQVEFFRQRPVNLASWHQRSTMATLIVHDDDNNRPEDKKREKQRSQVNKEEKKNVDKDSRDLQVGDVLSLSSLRRISRDNNKDSQKKKGGLVGKSSDDDYDEDDYEEDEAEESSRPIKPMRQLRGRDGDRAHSKYKSSSVDEKNDDKKRNNNNSNNNIMSTKQDFGGPGSKSPRIDLKMKRVIERRIKMLSDPYHWSEKMKKVYDETNQSAEAEKVFEEMKQHIIPTVATFNTWLSILANEGKAKKAFSVYNQMKKSNLKGDAYTFASLFKAFTLSPGDSSVEAEKAYEAVQRLPLKDLNIATNAYLSYCQAKGKMEAAESVFMELLTTRREAIDNRTVDIIMKGFVSPPNFDKAKLLLETAESLDHIEVDSFVYTSYLRVLRACGRRHMCPETKHLRNPLIAAAAVNTISLGISEKLSTQPHFEPLLPFLNVLITNVGQFGFPKDLEGVLRRYADMAGSFDSEINLHIADSFMHFGEHDKGLPYFQRVQIKDLRAPQLAGYVALLAFYPPSTVDAVFGLKELLTVHRALFKTTGAHMLMKLVDSSRFPHASDLFERVAAAVQEEKIDLRPYAKSWQERLRKNQNSLSPVVRDLLQGFIREASPSEKYVSRSRDTPLP